MKILAVIPAKGRSVGLPGKNMRLLAGHPLVCHSIAAALNAKRITRTICSTDSPEIADIAKRYGAEVPFLRPEELAQDHSTDFEVFDHLLHELRKREQYLPDILVQLRPTSPIRTIGFVDSMIERFLSHPNADSLRAVCHPSENPFKMWSLKDGWLKPLIPLATVEESFNRPRQQLPEVWWQTGALDIIRTTVITEKRSLSGQKILAAVLERETAIDIDSLADFMEAEKLLRERPELRQI